MKRSIIPVSVNQGKVATATREKLLAALSQDLVDVSTDEVFAALVTDYSRNLE